LIIPPPETNDWRDLNAGDKRLIIPPLETNDWRDLNAGDVVLQVLAQRALSLRHLGHQDFLHLPAQGENIKGGAQRHRSVGQCVGLGFKIAEPHELTVIRKQKRPRRHDR
jgi:hypothetical protein